MSAPAFLYFRSSLALEAMWLVESGVLSLSAYKKATVRGDILVVRRGCRNTPALVDYESLPLRVKDKIGAVLGRNPYEMVKFNPLAARLAPCPEASLFFEQYKTATGSLLPPATVRQYHAEACILNAIADIAAERTARASAMGHRAVGVWTQMVQLIADLDPVRWPHSLPDNPRSLERKLRAYKQGGFAALVHGNFKNGQVNAARVKTDDDSALLLDLVSDPRNLSDAQVVALYTAARPASPAISAAVVSRFRHAHEQEIHARRHGGSDFRARRLMTVKRSAPSAPLYFWTLDGWDAELLYQKTTVDKQGHNVTTYHNRVKLEVVLDACTKYPIGFAIADTESPDLVRAALRDAVNHTRELFGSRFRPAQIQMDHAGYKSLAETYERVAIHVTPAAVRNAKAKIIEPWFRFFNDRYCHLQTNWSGYGLQARKDSQPNTELLNKTRHGFPDRDGVVEQLTRFINAERARLRDEFVKKWDEMPAENRFPMTDEQYLLTFGVRSAQSYLMRNTGIKMTLPGTGGRTVDFDCFDHDFRRHAGERWTVIYDPDDTQTALAESADRRLRFTLERKYVQPMALIERRPDDAAELQRVRDFNKAEEKRVADFLGKIGDTAALRIDTATDSPDPVALRDYETLSKHLIVDSRGQHKTQKDDARLRLAALPTPPEDEPAPPAEADVLADALDRY